MLIDGHSFKQVLDLGRKFRQNWEMGGQLIPSAVGPLLQDNGNLALAKHV